MRTINTPANVNASRDMVSKNVILSRSISPLLIGDTSGTVHHSLSLSLSLLSFSLFLFVVLSLLSSPLSFYLCVRFREIKTTCQVSDAPNLSWQKYALSHAAEHPDTTAEVDFCPGFHCGRSAGLRMPDGRPDAHVSPKKTAIITGYLCVYSRARL